MVSIYKTLKEALMNRLGIQPSAETEGLAKRLAGNQDCKQTSFVNIIHFMNDELDSQIMSLKAQLAVLAAQTKSHESKSMFAELYGLLRDVSDSSEAEIDAVLYHLPKDTVD